MRIGQIVSIEANNVPHVQTGIITKRQKEEQAQYFWYEVLCNDGNYHIFPAFQLSPRLRQIRGCDEAEKTCEKSHNFQQHSTKTATNTLNYIHNQSQNFNFHSQK